MAERPFNLSNRARLAVVGLTTVLILAFVNFQIVAKERIVRNGATVLLRLAPQDPRSLLQGDYMALRYAMADEVADAAKAADVRDGRIVLALDEAQGARFVGLHTGEPLAPGQHLLTFRKRGDSVRLASDAWFFEEGQEETFARARYGELRVAGGGEAVLVGVRDADGNRLGLTARTP